MKIAKSLCVLVALATLGYGQAEKQPALRLRTEQASPGYTLVAPLQSGSTFLFDLNGEVVHEWKSETPPGNAVYLLPGGNLLRCVRVEDNEPFRGGGIGGRLQELAPDGSVVWDYSLATDNYHHHHDVEPLPNGNVLAIVWERLPDERSVSLGRDPEHIADNGWWVDAVLEIKPVYPSGGEIVWRWSTADHLIQDIAPDLEGYGDIPLHPERIDANVDHREMPPETAAQRKQREEMEKKMRALGYVGGDDDEDEDEDEDEEGERVQGGGGGSDWMHTNSIDYNATHDLIVLSVRTMGEVWVIDHSTTTSEAATDSGGRVGHGGDLLYRWGNPANYGAAGDMARQIFGQHDATFVEGADGSLRVLAFNNGAGRPGDVSYSTVVEIELPFDAKSGFSRAESKPFGPLAPVWTYTAPNPEDFFSSFISGAQRLSNGNTLIASGAKGRLFEVTQAGEIVWEFWNPQGGDLGRAGRGRGGPPGGGPPPQGDRPRGGPQGRAGERPEGPGRDGGPPPGKRRGGGPGGMAPGATFRALHLSPDDPGVRALLGTAR